MFVTSHMPPGSFLTSPAPSTAVLVRSLKDPIVLKRYECHFHLSQAQLERFFSRLYCKKLTQTRHVQVYFVGRNGRERHKAEWVRSAFLDASNRVVLVYACGNPVGPVGGHPVAIVKHSLPPSHTVVTLPGPAPPPLVTIPPGVPTFAEVTPSAPPLSAVPVPAPLMTAPPSFGGVSSTPGGPTPPMGHNAGFPWLLLAPLPFLAFSGGHGHGGSAGGPPPVIPPGHTVPEASSFVSLGVGMVVLMIVGRRRAR